MGFDDAKTNARKPSAVVNALLHDAGSIDDACLRLGFCSGFVRDLDEHQSRYVRIAVLHDAGGIRNGGFYQPLD